MAEYAAIPDPYCYPGTTVLRNRLGIRDAGRLQDFEAEITHQRADEPLPSGRLSYTHYKAVHRHLFHDVYAWAGRVRTVRIEKDESVFCYPEHIDAQMHRAFAELRGKNLLRGLSREGFLVEAAHFLAELNAVHAFREGNGRTQMLFMAMLAEHAGHPLDLSRLDRDAILAAMVASFHGDEAPLREQIRLLMR
ncbi:Fic/DOC family protein [Oleispirillum naphthae]|uniref:Fic/DOC family protein n=1 Tax=Oleispirillum naphthae TaxID=2838853 RepID=UPI0030823A96